MTNTTVVPGRHVDVNGVSLYVEEHGVGDPFLLINPGLCSSLVYQALIPLLTERYCVVAFDSRGHGRSTNPSSEMTYELLADDAAALVEELGLERPFVGGWSDGGEVALQFGLRHPGVARALVVGGTSLELGTEKARAEMRAAFHVDADGVLDYSAFAQDFAQTLLPMLHHLHPKNDEQLRAFMQQSLTMWLSYSGISREEVARIGAPTLVIVGDRDEHIPVQEGVRLYRSLPNAEMAIMPGTDHMRPLMDPATFARCVVDFLQRH